ncbi:hypothetical protein D3C72_2352770 [compost metagenome]
MAMPGAELDLTRRTPVAPFMAVSIGSVTRVSTSSGARPWASASTVTVGAVRSGKTSTGMGNVVQVPQTKRATVRASTTMRLWRAQWMIRSSMGFS